mgnify:CR=1 FL=1
MKIKLKFTLHIANFTISFNCREREREEKLLQESTYRSAFLTAKHSHSSINGVDVKMKRQAVAGESVSFRKIDFCNLENKHPAMRRATTTTTMMRIHQFTIQ